MLVHTARGPTPRNHPANPSVLYIIFKALMTEDASMVAAECMRSDVDGEDVEIGRFGETGVLVEVDTVACLLDA